MTKEQSGFQFNQNWYDMWMEQSKQFFNTANSNLKNVFEGQTFSKPEDHLQQIQAWLETLKSQWNVMNVSQDQKQYEKYWKAMIEMSTEASELLLAEWIKRTRDNKPISDVRELYELWLNCCQEVYTKKIHSANYQEMYGEFMNAAMKFWKTAIPK